MTNNKTLGQAIRDLRNDKGWGLREFAGKIGKSPAFISDVELGRRYPSEDLLIEISKILGVKVTELKQFDTRPPLETFKKISESNPQYGYALRKVADEFTPEEFVKWVNKKLKDD